MGEQASHIDLIHYINLIHIVMQIPYTHIDQKILIVNVLNYNHK
jgi:hypothetical protein